MKFRWDIYAATEIETGCILYPINEVLSEEIVMLNTTAWFIAKAIGSGLGVDDVFKAYAQHFKIDSVLARSEVSKCLATLTEVGVLDDE